MTTFAMLLSLTLPLAGQNMNDVIASVRKKFPSVRQLSTEQLANWIADTNRVTPLLVDAREAEEFSVSHLEKARNLKSPREVKLVAASNQQPIVVYCSVGYRSSALAEKLQRAGFVDVSNLEGSLFQWANEGRPLFRGTNQVRVVHPFNAKWGKLLDSGYQPKTGVKRP